MVSLLYSLINTKVNIHKTLFSVNANMLQTKCRPCLFYYFYLFICIHNYTNIHWLLMF